VQYILLFLEGIITFISPCLLPLLPLYVSYFAGGEAVGRRKALFNALGFILGFAVVFVVLGAFAGIVGKILSQHQMALNLITGGIVVLFGLNYLGILKISLLNRTQKGEANTKNLGFFTSVVFGIVFSIGWTPCVGAFLGSALMIASGSGSALKGMAMLLTFSLGLGLPFLASALLIDRLKGTFDFIKRNYKVINFISGLFLVILGILMMSGTMGYFLSLLTF